ncbi:AAEL000294-PA [Aedes aegypti]|uniref:AAEL000294-PA n=1 Tax=Aedes aegypti TaxID=7159 RepID=Q17PP2_AEDAE|nr:AAEL000294-PA [Aedes aegypti]
MKFKFRPCSAVSTGLLILLGCGQASVYEGCQQEVNVKNFLSEICDNSSPLMSLTVKSFDVDHTDRSLEHVCKEGAHGLLLWLKSANFGGLPELDTSLKYIGRATFDEDFSGYCTYNASTQVCSNDAGEVTGSLMVLGEKYPERYELRDMVFKKWTNSTRLGSPILAYATLKNRDTTYKYIDQDISYLSDTRMEFLLPATVISGLPLSVFRGKVETYKTISGETHYGRSFKTINAVRYMSPATIINVTVVGTEERAYREFRGKLISVYTDEEGFGWSRSLTSVEGASVETALTETHVEFGLVANLYEESQLQPGAPTLSPSIPHTDHKYPGQSNLPKAEGIHIHISETELTQVYPGFRNFAIGAGILFFTVLGVALLDILRRIVKDRRAKRLHTGKYSKVNGR